MPAAGVLALARRPGEVPGGATTPLPGRHNREEINARRRECRAADPEKYREARRRYRAANRERIKAICNWYVMPPDGNGKAGAEAPFRPPPPSPGSPPPS